MAPETIPTAVCLVGALFAMLTYSLSRGPGWRSLRSFALCAAFGSMYAATDIAPTAPGLSPGFLIWNSRASVALAGLHGLTWFAYTAAQANRKLTRFEAALIGIAFVFVGLTFVPGVVVADEVRSRTVSWLGWTYTDGVPTTFGELVYLYYCFGTLYLVVLHVRARAWRHVIGLSGLLLGGVCDSLSSADVLSLPYLLDLAYLLLTVMVGGVLAQRVVEGAKALEISSARLAETQDALVRRERLAAVGEMAAVVAHEVRNPLAIIFTAAASLARPEINGEDRKELLRIILEEASRLKGMVSELLDLARPRKLALRSVPLADVVEDAIAAARHGEEAREPSWVVFTDDAPSATLACDVELVRQAVINLVANALQADGRRAPVRVTLRARDGFGEIAVIDDGAGVAPEIEDKIFTPFFTTRPRGTGLGLSFVQRTAEAHGGEVKHARTEGGGATFVLRLPLEEQDSGVRSRDLASASFAQADPPAP